MNTTTTILKKSGQAVIIAAACLQFSQCDSGTNQTFNPDATFILGTRYDKEALEGELTELVDMPDFLLSGDRIIIDQTTAVSVIPINGELIEEDVDTEVRSSGQIFIGNFRFNYNNRFGSDDNVGFLIRSDDHAIGEGEDDFVSSLLQLRDTSFGNGSLAEALIVDPNDVGDGLVSLTETQVKTIQNAIRSLGYTVDDDLRVLGEQFYSFEADSTNQLLVDENKITGNVAITKVWRSLIFEFETVTTIDDLLNGNEGTVVGGEYKITLGGSLSETDDGTFEIQLKSL